MLIEGLSFGGAVLCVAAGGIVLLAYAVFMGANGSRTGLPSTAMSAEALGVSGARCIPALLICVASVGWFGVQAAMCGSSFSAITEQALGISVSTRVTTLFFGALITASAVYGYRAAKYLFSVITPILYAILLFTLIWRAFSSEIGIGAAISAWRPTRPMSYAQGIALVFGTWAMGAFVTGDLTRYAQKPRDAVTALITGLAPSIPLMLLGGAVFRALEGTYDITFILSVMGFPAIALLFLLLSVWAINTVNAYNGGIALGVMLGLPERRLKAATVVAGGIGTILGAAGILSLFTGFLSLISSLVPPVGGVLIGAKIADMLERRRGGGTEPPGEDARLDPGFHLPGIAAYATGALAAWLTSTAYPLFIPPLSGIAVAAVFYAVSFAFKARGGTVRAKAQSKV
jgi:cytosine permease